MIRFFKNGISETHFHQASCSSPLKQESAHQAALIKGFGFQKNLGSVKVASHVILGLSSAAQIPNHLISIYPAPAEYKGYEAPRKKGSRRG